MAFAAAAPVRLSVMSTGTFIPMVQTIRPTRANNARRVRTQLDGRRRRTEQRVQAVYAAAARVRISVTLAEASIQTAQAIRRTHANNARPVRTQRDGRPSRTEQLVQAACAMAGRVRISVISAGTSIPADPTIHQMNASRASQRQAQHPGQLPAALGGARAATAVP